MMRRITDEEKKLSDIFESYFDYVKCDLLDDAPIEAREALKKFRDIGKNILTPKTFEI